MIDADGAYVAPAFPIFDPPDESVYHPLKVLLASNGVGSVTDPPELKVTTVSPV